MLRPKRVLCPLFLLTQLFVWSPLHADQLILTPSLSLRQEYNDNVSGVTSGKRSDFISTVSPRITLNEGTERVNASLAGGLNSLHYLRDTNNSSVGYFLQGAGHYTATPRLALSTDLSYLRDASASSIDPESSLIISSKATHQSYRLGGRYAVHELLSTSLGLSYARDDYDSPIYLGSRHYLGSAGVDYDLGAHLPGATLAQLLTFRSDVTDQSRVNNLNATLGLSWRLDELWRLSLNAGGRFTGAEFQQAGGAGRKSHEEAGGVGNLSLAYAGERVAGTLALSHDLTAASGRNGATQRTGANLSLSRRFTRQFSGNLQAGYARNRSGQGQFAVQAIEERATSLGGSLRYEPFEAPGNLAIEASYTYSSIDYRLLGTQMEQNIVMLRVSWPHPMCR